MENLLRGLTGRRKKGYKRKKTGMYNGKGEWRPAVSFCYLREIDKSNGIFSRLPVITEASKREDDIRLIMSSEGLWDGNSMI